MVESLRASSMSDSHSAPQGRPAAASEASPDAVSSEEGDEGVGVVEERAGCAELMYGPWWDRRSRFAERKACYEGKG